MKPERISLENFDQEWEEAKSDKDIPLSQLHEALLGTHYPHSIVIDCTASETVAAQHKVWLQNSIHVRLPPRSLASASSAVLCVVLELVPFVCVCVCRVGGGTSALALSLCHRSASCLPLSLRLISTISSSPLPRSPHEQHRPHSPRSPTSHALS